jgi:ComF family protein
MSHSKNKYKAILNIWEWFLSALFPQKCIVCRKEGSLLCPEHKKFPPPPINKVIFQYVDSIQACTAYTDKTAKTLIENCKYFGNKEAARFIAEEIDKKIDTNDIIIPVPLHWTRKLWRGFNQTERIAENLSKGTMAPYLKRIKKTAQQAKLSKKKRETNIQEAFVWDFQAPINTKAVLLDDVVASGSTLDECAKALKKAGFQEVNALVFARGGK